LKIVITGALGHIGSQLSRDLAYEFPRAEFLLIDNLMTQRFASLFDLPVIGRYKFIEGDVTTMNLSPCLEGAHVVVHLAAITDAAGSFDRAAELEANNFKATQKVAQACTTAGVRLISISSTSVYGTQSDLVSEDCSEDELKPQSPYASTKMNEEKLLAEMSISDSLKTVICRFGTIFGPSPGMRFHTAVNKFCWQAVMGQSITVWSTAYGQMRPYLALSDASRVITFLIKNELFTGDTFNVLTLNATVREIVETIGEFVPKLEVKFTDSVIMNQLSYEVSTRKIRAAGFDFVGNLRRGIAETIGRLRRANFS